MKSRIAATALAASVLMTSGCAALRINVDVYKGPLNMSDDAKLAYAVGLAKNTYLWVREYHANRYQDGRTHYWNAAMQAYEGTSEIPSARGHDDVTAVRAGSERNEVPAGNPGVEQCWEAFHANPTREHRKALARALARFGAVCQDLGRVEGLRAAVEIDLFGWFAASTENLHKVETGVHMEDTGRWIVFLADDAADDSERTTISRLMESVTTGHVGTITGRHYQHRLQDAYWTEINSIPIIGSGDTEYVIVKDEIGNWHIKGISTSQDEIINAIFDGAEGVVNILAGQYGITPGEENGKISEHFVQQQARADDARAIQDTLRAAQLTFTAAVASAAQEKDDRRFAERLKAAALLFASQLKGMPELGEAKSEPASSGAVSGG